MASLLRGRFSGFGIRIPRLRCCRPRRIIWRPFAKEIKTDKDLQQLLNKYGKQDHLPLSINQMYDFGRYEAPGRNQKMTLLAAAQFVHEELPVRCSHLIQDLQSLPFGLSQNSAIKEVVKLFHYTIEAITAHPRPKTSSDEELLRSKVKEILRMHRNMVLHMRSALASDLLSNDEKLQLQPFLDRFFATRIGNRTVLSHYVHLGDERKDGWVGLINDQCRIENVVLNAFQIASEVVKHFHPEIKAPPVVIKGSTSCQIRYFESHLEFILTEIFHNSIYSTWLHHSQKTATVQAPENSADSYDSSIMFPSTSFPSNKAKRERVLLPDIQVVIAEGSNDVTIAISDQGGGFRRKYLQSVWTHLYKPDSNKGAPDDNMHFDTPSSTDTSPLINSYTNTPSRSGLAVCRLYARHFGGELAIQVMEHYGCDVFVTIPKDGDIPETLPRIPAREVS
mmetsp:Transcript_1242/g.1755  ORF Transcript_1242/g.1755 Transcript_1242/m.1755 type:complete len:450 (+) Transcript_1242:95-1444(+)